jgi:hypothetical protein
MHQLVLVPSFADALCVSDDELQSRISRLIPAYRFIMTTMTWTPQNHTAYHGKILVDSRSTGASTRGSLNPQGEPRTAAVTRGTKQEHGLEQEFLLVQ